MVNRDLRDWKKWRNRTYDETVSQRQRFPLQFQLLAEIDPANLAGSPPQFERYDTISDPDEVENLANDPAAQLDLRRLLAALSKWSAATGDPYVRFGDATRDWVVLCGDLGPSGWQPERMGLILMPMIGYVEGSCVGRRAPEKVAHGPAAQCARAEWPGKMARLVGLLLLFLAGVSLTACTESDPQDEQFEQLLALGYLEGVDSDPDPGRVGVTTHVVGRASAGHKLFVPYGSRQADLIDAQGTVLHSWAVATGMGWQHVELGEDLSLYVIEGDVPDAVAENRLLKLDKDSNVVWTLTEDAHHDLDVADNGDVYVLTRGRRLVDYRGHTLPINENYIAVLDPEGRLKSKTPLYDMVERHVPARVVKRLLERRRRREEAAGEDLPRGIDILHTNTLEIVRRDLAYANKGSILLSLNRLSLVIIIDNEMQGEVWSWGPGEIEHAHMPTVLPNDNILLFENGSKRKYSRVIELDPVRREIVWEYVGDPKEDFFSDTRGSAQQLSNGNILVTESNKGHAFEIDRDEGLLWDYWNPHREADGTRRAIYRMIEVD